MCITTIYPKYPHDSNFAGVLLVFSPTQENAIDLTFLDIDDNTCLFGIV